MLLNTAGVNSNKTQWVNKKTIEMSNGLAADSPSIGCKALFHLGRTLVTLTWISLFQAVCCDVVQY